MKKKFRKVEMFPDSMVTAYHIYHIALSIHSEREQMKQNYVENTQSAKERSVNPVSVKTSSDNRLPLLGI